MRIEDLIPFFSSICCIQEKREKPCVGVGVGVWVRGWVCVSVYDKRERWTKGESDLLLQIGQHEGESTCACAGRERERERERGREW